MSVPSSLTARPVALRGSSRTSFSWLMLKRARAPNPARRGGLLSAFLWKLTAKHSQLEVCYLERLSPLFSFGWIMTWRDIQILCGKLMWCSVFANCERLECWRKVTLWQNAGRTGPDSRGANEGKPTDNRVNIVSKTNIPSRPQNIFIKRLSRRIKLHDYISGVTLQFEALVSEHFQLKIPFPFYVN